MADNKVNSGLLEFSEDQKVFVALDAETSEVKKAVTIDGDGVETDITGVDVTVEALNVTENGTYSEEGKAYSPVVVDVESDFSIATLSIVNDGGFDISLDLASLNERGFSNGGYDELTSTDELPVILYEGQAVLVIVENPTSANISVSGAIENVAANKYVITGDCTMTITNTNL